MDIDLYQAKAMETAIYPEAVRVVYPILGLLGETAELAAKVRDALFPEGRDGLSSEELKLWDTIAECVQAGERAERLKKCYRDQPDYYLTQRFADSLAVRLINAMPTLQSKAIQKEVGDNPWYLAAVCRDIGFTPSAVLQTNLDKLAARKKANTLTGSGDDR